MLTNFSRSLELMDRLETNYIRLLCYDFPAHFGGTYKSYEYSRLCTILEGEKNISVNNNETFQYDSERYLLLPPSSSVHMSMDRPTKAVVFELNTQLIEQVNEKVSNAYSIDSRVLAQKNYYVGTKNSDVREILNKITTKSLNREDNCEFLIDLYAQELVFQLTRNKGIHYVLNFASKNPVSKAIRYMNEYYTQPVSIKQLSYDLDMSEANFCRYFKKITSMTPNEYLTKIKLHKAKELLKQTSVTEAAFELGYENISYFIALFKKQYGITPKQYKISNNPKLLIDT